jgi:WD40 repeat protein
MDDGSSSTKSTLLISGDVAGDSYAYNLLEKGRRLLLGHTASMLTDIAIVDRDDIASSSRRRLLLTADRDEKIRISQFPDSYILEGFLLGHTAYVTAFTTIPSSYLAVSCGGDMTLRLWNIDDKSEICSMSTCDNNNKNEIPTAITVSGCGQILAVIFDESKRLSIYKISHKDINDQNNNNNTSPSLTLLGSVDCPSQPLSLIFHGKEVESNNNVTVLMGDPNYVVTYNIQDEHDDDNKVVSAISESSSSMQELLDVASKEEISMPKTILEKRHGDPILHKQNETRGPAGNDAPWNRVERIEIAKGHQKRSNAKKAEKKRKKRRTDAEAEADNTVIE